MEILQWTEAARNSMPQYMRGFFYAAMMEIYPKYKGMNCKLTDIIEGPDFYHIWFWNDKNVPFYISIIRAVPG